MKYKSLFIEGTPPPAQAVPIKNTLDERNVIVNMIGAGLSYAGTKAHLPAPKVGEIAKAAQTKDFTQFLAAFNKAMDYCSDLYRKAKAANDRPTILFLVDALTWLATVGIKFYDNNFKGQGPSEMGDLKGKLSSSLDVLKKTDNDIKSKLDKINLAPLKQTPIVPTVTTTESRRKKKT
jgi:hypothetical protein